MPKKIIQHTDKHVPPFGTMTIELLEQIADDNSDRYTLVYDDYIAECNGDNDAYNTIVFKDDETGLFYRVTWWNDGYNYVSTDHMKDSYLTVELVEEKEVKVIQYFHVATLQEPE